MEIGACRRASGRAALVVICCFALSQVLADQAAASVPPGPVQAQPTPLVIGVAAAGEMLPAVATKPAKRLSQMGGMPFPMDPLPRCEMLNNFADGRSGRRAHEGTDILATLGQAVFAVADGTLTSQHLDGGTESSVSGNARRLTLPDRTFFFYAHLSAFAPGLPVGAAVRKGDLIGYVGDTGNPGTGNYHLHFEYHPQGKSAVNPLPFLEIPSSCKVY